MLVMPPPKKQAKTPPPAKPAKKRGPVIFMTLDDATDSQLQAFLAAQRVEPSAAAVALVALREFLAREGFRRPDAK
jgi:hypothetical protein